MDETGVHLDLLAAERVVGPFEESARLLVLPLGGLELAEGEAHLDAGEQRPPGEPELVGPFGVLAGPGKLLEPLAGFDLPERDPEVQVGPGDLDPVADLDEMVDRPLVPGDRLAPGGPRRAC